jgi:hypothetical protein
MASSVCASLVEVCTVSSSDQNPCAYFLWYEELIIILHEQLGELKRLSKAMRKRAKEIRGTADKYEDEQYLGKMKQSDDRLLALAKAAVDVVVAVGLLQLAPNKVTPRVTGALGFITSLISCYQVTEHTVSLAFPVCLQLNWF